MFLLAVVPLSVLVFLLTVAPDLEMAFEQADFDLERRLSEACNTVLWNFRGSNMLVHPEESAQQIGQHPSLVLYRLVELCNHAR